MCKKQDPVSVAGTHSCLVKSSRAHPCASSSAHVPVGSEQPGMGSPADRGAQLPGSGKFPVSQTPGVEELLPVGCFLLIL